MIDTLSLTAFVLQSVFLSVFRSVCLSLPIPPPSLSLSHTHTHTHLHTRACARPLASTHVRTHSYMHTRARAHTHTHKHTHKMYKATKTLTVLTGRFVCGTRFWMCLVFQLDKPQLYNRGPCMCCWYTTSLSYRVYERVGDSFSVNRSCKGAFCFVLFVFVWFVFFCLFCFSLFCFGGII